MADRDDVERWTAAYERAWRASDPDAIGALFTEDAEYRRSPVEPPIRGLQAIRAIWGEDEGADFRFRAEPIAVEGDRAVVRAHVEYLDPPQSYVDLWVLRFAPDGRAAEFEEWPYWPGRGYTAREG